MPLKQVVQRICHKTKLPFLKKADHVLAAPEVAPEPQSAVVESPAHMQGVVVQSPPHAHAAHRHAPDVSRDAITDSKAIVGVALAVGGVAMALDPTPISMIVTAGVVVGAQVIGHAVDIHAADTY